MKPSIKKTEIMDCAQELIQKRGYNGFSYADISNLVGIRKASIHHHFPTKADLGIAVIERYREIFNLALSEIGPEQSWDVKIRRYTDLYKQVLSKDKLCLCGMMASDVETLPLEVKTVIQEFFLDNVKWLSGVFSTQSPDLSQDRVVSISWQLINSLQGAVMIARMLNDVTMFDASCHELLLQLQHIFWRKK